MRYDNPNTQLGRTYLVMKRARERGQWLQLHEIAAEIRQRFQKMDSEAAISARLRDLRNRHLMSVTSHCVHHDGQGPHEYMLVREYGEMSSTNFERGMDLFGGELHGA